jgi:hypothetical protein
MNRVYTLVIGFALALTAGASAETVLAPRTTASAVSRRVVRVQATLAKQCPRIKSVNFLIKADTSNHIPGGDSRRGSYSVIGSGSNCSPCPSGRCNILYKDGRVAGSVGYYGQWSRSHGGNGCARYYGGSGGAPAHSASSIINTARRKGRKLYLDAGSTCYEWNSDLRRVGNT